MTRPKTETAIVGGASRPLVAMEVAEQFLATTGYRDDPEESDLVREVALLVGQHLHERNATGHWEAFDAAEFYGQVAFLGKSDRVGLTVRLLGLFAFLATERLIEPARASIIIDGIEAAAPINAVTPALAQSSRRLCAAIVELDAATTCRSR